MNDAQQGNENLETTQEQVVEDAHVTIYTVTKKTEVHVTSSSRSSDLASKFLKNLDIPHADVEIVSPLDVHVHHEVSKTQAPTLLTIPVSVITESSPILPQGVSLKPHSTYEAASTLTEFELKKILLDKMEKSKSYLAAPEHRDCYYSLKKSYDLDKDFFFSYDVYSLKNQPLVSENNDSQTFGSSKGTKSQPKSSGKSDQSEEPVFEVADSDMPQDQEGNMGDNEDKPRKETASRRKWFKKPTPPQEPTDPDCEHSNRLLWIHLEWPENQEFSLRNLALSEKLDWENPEGDDYPFDLSKPLPLIMHGKRQRVPFEYFINNDLGYLQGGVSTMTYTTSTTKTKADQYDLPSIEDMVMRKHGYGYLEEIVVRRADNVLYRFKEGDFPRLRINDIEDMLLLMVQNRLTNLLGDDVADFPDTTRPDLRKRHTYTPYKDPQGFIYVDDFKRNRLMRSDELYKFSDGTLTRLLSSLEDITKNIDMEYLPKRRWSTLEKKRAHFMIKDINKLLKERRMMRSLEKFVRGRLYGTDLRLLQRTI
ncbi:hypothetical protein Tco_0848317 [Tanacetum coccineum]